jgi:hypothetical protein
MTNLQLFAALATLCAVSAAPSHLLGRQEGDPTNYGGCDKCPGAMESLRASCGGSQDMLCLFGCDVSTPNATR